MTILNQLKTLSDYISSELDNLDYVDTSARVFLNHLPIEIAIDYFTEEEITSAGLQCGTKYTTPVRGGIECRKIPPSKKRLASNTSSLYLSTNLDPVFYKENNKLFVLPTPNAEYEAYVSKIPNDFIPSNATTALEEIPNVPENSYHIILLYAGHLILYKKAVDERGLITNYLTEVASTLTNFNNSKPVSVPSISDFAFGGTIPAAVTLSFTVGAHSVDFSSITDIADSLSTDLSGLDLTFDTTRLDETAANDDLSIDLSADFAALVLDIEDETFDLNVDLSSNPPTLDLSGITAPTVDLQSAIDAINKASDFIGELTTDANTGDVTSTEVPTGAFWLDDEDPEMVQSAAQLASQEINKGTSLANSQISTLTAYQAEIDAKLSEFRGRIEAFTSTNNLKAQELSTKLNLYRSKIEARTTEVEAKATVINSKLTELKSRLEKAISKLQLELQARDSENQIIINREKLKIEEFSARVQNYSAKLSKIVQREQLELQQWQASVQKEVQENQLKLQKFQNDLQAFSTQFQTEVGEWTSNVEKNFREFDSKLNLATTELQSAQTSLSKFQMTSQNYVNIIQESQSLYQKYMNEFKLFLGITNGQ